MPFVRFSLVALTFLTNLCLAQDFDKKAFCSGLQKAMTALETSNDSLKGDYAGANSYGIQQWKARLTLEGASTATYEYSNYLSDEYRATYVMMENAKQADAAAFYKQLISAAKSCYGMAFTVEEKVTVEHRGGVKIEQLESEFTRYENGHSTGHQQPYIHISSTAYETGETFEVLVELISEQ